MNINKIIIVIGITLAIFITFIFIQFNPFAQTATENKSAEKPPSTVKINDQTFNIHVARTDEEKQRGLSGRESLPLDEGMLFLFEEPNQYTFWMKEMQFPIDIIFINDETIVSISENATPPTELNENPQCNVDVNCYTADQPANRVLEINAGLAKKHNIKPGDKVELNLQ